MAVQRWFSIMCWQTVAWWRGRQWRSLLLGLPALTGGVVLCILAIAVLLTPTQELEARYLVQAENALKTKDYATAVTCYDRLAYRSADHPELLFGLALASEALDQKERARVIMAGLASADQTGYGPAHVWQARQLLQSGMTADDRKTAEKHLLHALDAHVEDTVSVHSLLCELYLIDGQLDQAEVHLLKAVKMRPQLRLRGARIYALKGDKTRARNEAELAVAYYRGRASADNTDLPSRLGWADALTFLERFPEALASLDEGWTSSRNAVYPLAMARVYAAWYDSLGRETDADMAKRLTLLEKGLHHDPGNQLLLDRLLGATKLGNADGQRAREALHALLASGKAPATVHFALGVDALQHGETAQARLHWERALELSPETPMVANNLAWLIATSKEPDLPRALMLVNLAIEHSPNDLNFRHTRGNILSKMGRDKDALKDLEAALPAYPEKADLHVELARVYDRLGVPLLAAEHRRQAQLKSVPKPAKQP